jgi:hypothetical protein
LVFKIKKPKKQREKDLFNPPQSMGAKEPKKVRRRTKGGDAKL